MNAEPFFKIKVEDEVYELDKLRLGDLRILKNEFGVENLETLDTADPNALAGIFYCAAKRQHPLDTHEQLLARVDNIDVLAIEAEDDSEVDPQEADEAEADTPEAGS